jgi:hypothetical protein
MPIKIAHILLKTEISEVRSPSKRGTSGLFLKRFYKKDF